MLRCLTRVENAATVEEKNASIHLSFNTLAATIALITSMFLLGAFVEIWLHPVAFKTLPLSGNYSAFSMGTSEYICLVRLFLLSSGGLLNAN